MPVFYIPPFVTDLLCFLIRICCGQCDLYYREVMVFVTAGATVISFLVLLTMAKTRIGEFKGKILCLHCKKCNHSDLVIH